MQSQSISKKRVVSLVSISAMLMLIALSLPPVFADDGVVNVYSARKEALILPLLNKFKAETGINFRLITGKADELLKRIETEGAYTPADVFITVDAGRLQRAKEAGILQHLDTVVVDEKVPAHLKDKDDYWTGLSQRARVIFYAKDRVNPDELSTYAALANDKWKDRVCIRSSSNIYNQSLVASMIDNLGEQETEQWAKHFVDNFAKDPSGGDTDQIRAVAAGQCDVAVANTYYFGRLLNSDKPEDKAVVEKVGAFWPNQETSGTHINVSGVGIIKYAKNRDAAKKLLAYLYSPSAQKWYAEVNNEYPVVEGIEISDTLKSLGDFEADDINLTVLGENNAAALKLMDRAGWQ